MKSRLPKKTVFLWQIRLILISLLPIYAFYYFSFLTKWILLGIAVIVPLTLIAVFWYIPAYFKSYEISFPNGAIVINRGVIIKSTHIMPFTRLIYAKSLATPFARMLGLSALVLKAARSGILIPELSKADVETFMDYLSKEGDA